MPLPRTADNKNLIAVKVKHKYEPVLLFESVRPNFAGSFLRSLKQHNHMYRDVEIDLDNI